MRCLMVSVLCFTILFKYFIDDLTRCDVTFEHNGESETVSVDRQSDRDKMLDAAAKKLKTFKIPDNWSIKSGTEGGKAATYDKPCVVR